MVIVAGSAWMYSLRLPDPEHSNRDELVRWMVTRDLGQESVHTREVLAQRFDREFVGVNWKEFGEQMTVEHRQQLAGNLPLLLKPWFMEKLDTYGQCDESQQLTCIDDTIDRMVELSGINCLLEEDESETQTSPKITQLLIENVEVWKEQAGSAEKQRIGKFFALVQARWFMRTLSGDIPSLP